MCSFNGVMLVVKERTKKMVLEQNIHLEDFGGDVQAVCISALKVNNIIHSYWTVLQTFFHVHQICISYAVVI